MYESSTIMVTTQPELEPYPPPPKDYFIWSILNLLCCCLPLGLTAMIFSIKSRNAAQENKMLLATKHSGTACGLNIAATVVGIFAIIILLITYSKAH